MLRQSVISAPSLPSADRPLWQIRTARVGPSTSGGGSGRSKRRSITSAAVVVAARRAGPAVRQRFAAAPPDAPRTAGQDGTHGTARSLPLPSTLDRSSAGSQMRGTHRLSRLWFFGAATSSIGAYGRPRLRDRREALCRAAPTLLCCFAGHVDLHGLRAAESQRGSTSAPTTRGQAGERLPSGCAPTAAVTETPRTGSVPHHATEGATTRHSAQPQQAGSSHRHGLS